MYRNIFIAWFCLGILALCFAAFLILMLIGADRSANSLGFLMLLGFVPFFRYVVFRWEKADERDILFWKQAILTGFAFGFTSIYCIPGLMLLVGSILVLSGMGTGVVSWAGITEPQHLYQISLSGGLVVFVFSFAVKILYLYHKGKHTEYGGQINEIR